MKRNHKPYVEVMPQGQLEDLLVEIGIEVDLPILEDRPGPGERTWFHQPGMAPLGRPLGYLDQRDFKRIVSPREFKRCVQRRRGKFTTTFPPGEALATIAEVVMAAQRGQLDRNEEGYHAFPSRRGGLEPFHLGMSTWVTYIPCLLSTPIGWKFEWLNGNCAVLLPTIVVEK
nr:Unknown Function [uncultured bacterium]